MSHDKEQALKALNREETLNRSRQWEVVNSSDDASSKSSNHHQHHHSKRNKTDQTHSHNDDKDERHKGKKDKDKKHKKHKRDKKEKNSKDRKHQDSRSAINQNEYGKYGIIRADQFYQKQREFEAYMSEIKNMPGIMGQSKREISSAFEGFMEDYNTATMPHEKFYHYEQWEIEDYKRQQREKLMCSDREKAAFADEQERQQELASMRAAAERQQFQRIKATLSKDTSLRDSMRRQDEMRLELQQAYQRGDQATVKRLERTLAPETDKGDGHAHPWA